MVKICVWGSVLVLFVFPGGVIDVYEGNFVG